MGVAMRKRAQNYVSMFFGMAHKLAWRIYWHGAQVGMG